MLGRAGPRGRGESSTGAPDATPEESGTHARGGISPPGTQPGADGGFPHVRRARPFPEDDGAGRVPRRTSADGPTVDNADDGRPLSLFPSRVPRNAPRASSCPARTDPPTRQTRPPPPKDLRRRRAPTRPATRRRRPTAVSPKAAPEREVTSPRRQNRIPGPEEGRVTAAPRSWERCRGVRGSEATPHGTPHERHTHATRTARPRTRERQRRGRAGGTARGGHGRWTGGAREPTATQPRSSRSAPRPEACAPPSGSGGGDSGSRGTRACAQRGPSRSFPDHGRNNIPGSGAARRRHDNALFCPAWSLPGLGAGRRGPQRAHKTRSGFPPQSRDAARGTRPKLRASGGHRAGWGDPGGSDGRTPSTVPFVGSLEKALFSLRAGGTDPARRAPGRGSPRAGGDTAR